MHAWKSKQTKKISNASSFTHPPSLRSLALFLLFSTFFSLRSAPFPSFATCHWSSLLLKLFFPPLFFFFSLPSSLYDLLEGGKERGGLEGSSHSKLERKGLRRVTAPRGAPPPVKAARRRGSGAAGLSRGPARSLPGFCLVSARSLTGTFPVSPGGLPGAPHRGGGVGLRAARAGITPDPLLARAGKRKK